MGRDNGREDGLVRGITGGRAGRVFCDPIPPDVLAAAEDSDHERNTGPTECRVLSHSS